MPGSRTRVPGFAQSYITSPKGFLTKPAGATSAYFGGDSFGRVMFLDGELGNAAMAQAASCVVPRLPTVYRRKVLFQPDAGALLSHGGSLHE